MAGIYGYSREAVRVKVKKCESNVPPEWRKFSVDPQITSVEVLYSILAKAFDIRSDFSISYRAIDPTGGNEQFLTVLSDWDLDAAFLRTHNYSVQTGSEPCLNLRVDVKSFSEVNNWEVNSPLIGQKNVLSTEPIQNLQQQQHQQNHSHQQQLQAIGTMGQKYVQNMQTKLPGLIMNHMEKTFSMVQRALNFAEEQIPIYPPRPPLSDSEFRGFLDSVGQILKTNELRRVIFLGGIDPSLRRVVWKHILNVYPKGMTGRQRMDYMKRKAAEYYRLRDVWKVAVQLGPVHGDDLAYVTSMVRKDVLRTDRLHPFYAGNDENKNIASLFNILTTYALNHPSVSYCQGMSDIASPLLVTMSDEAHAYICFCAIMSRLQANFMLDGIAMTLKFTHLAEAIQYYDPEFFEYLKSQQADDLLFCYRWLLLELKREFPFEDSLRMLEVQWSSLRNEPPEKELSLFEKEFIPTPINVIQQQITENRSQQNSSTTNSPVVIMRKQRENHYTKVCALRRQSSTISLQSGSPITTADHSTLSGTGKLDVTRRLNQSLDENISRRNQQIKSRKNIVKTHQSLDEQKMLMLMQNTSIFETVTKSDEDINNDNFEKVNNLIEENYIDNSTGIENNIDVKSKIIFHPTNPFLNDAYKDDMLIDNNDKILRPKTLNDNDDTAFKIEHSNCNKNEEDAKHTKNGFNPVSDTNIKVPNNLNNNNINDNNISNHKDTIFKNTENILTKQLISKKGGHFKELKEKIASGKKGILASLDKIENQFDLTTSSSIVNRTTPSMQQQQHQTQAQNQLTTTSNNNLETKGQKMVKNFNEFLTFTSNRFSDKIIQNCDISRDEDKVKKLKIDEQNDLKNSIENIDRENDLNPQVKHLQLPLNSVTNQSKFQQQFSLDGSSPDDSQDYYPMTTSITRELRLEMENLDRQVFGQHSLDERCNKLLNDTGISYEKLGKNSIDLIDVKDEEILSCPASLIVMRKPLENQMQQNQKQLMQLANYNEQSKRISTCSNNDVFVWENPLHQISATSSCNFNDVYTSHDYQQSHGESFQNSIQTVKPVIDDEYLMLSSNHNQTTPDEQQDLEYDGDIIIECISEEGNSSDKIRKTCTPLRLIQQNKMTKTNSTTNNINEVNNDSDSDNQEFISKNPFLEYKSIAFDIDDTCLMEDGDDLKPNIVSDSKTEIIIPTGTRTAITSNCDDNKSDKITNDMQSINDQISIINPQFGEDAAELDTTTTNLLDFSQKQNTFLPPPSNFGDGNPFLIFLCLTLLLQHRNTIIKNSMDYNEMAMHFDKMVRKHDVTRVLNQARRMYFEYLKTQNSLNYVSGNKNPSNEPTKS